MHEHNVACPATFSPRKTPCSPCSPSRSLPSDNLMSRAFKEAATACRLAQSRNSTVLLRATPRTMPSTRIQAHAHARIRSFPTSPRYFSTSNPSRLSAGAPHEESLSPVARSIIATTKAVRNLVILTTSTVTLGLFLWTGTHAYLEQYKCPSPEGLSATARNCLHGAWVREEVSPDPEVAEIYLVKALDLTREELEAKYKGSTLQGMELDIEKDAALVEIQNRLARFYGRIGQDERAATIWTRLWKLSEKSSRPLDHQESSSTGSGSMLGGWMGSKAVERPLMTRLEGVAFAKQAADCWMRMGEYELAEEALGWTLQQTTAHSNNNMDQVGTLSTLGALCVRRGQFDHALSLFVKALQLVQNHRSQLAEEDKDAEMWYCREAILTNSIGETLYGAATAPTAVAPASTESTQPTKTSSWKFWSSSSTSSTSGTSGILKVTPQQSAEAQKKEEALGWMQKAITMVKEKTNQHRDCAECAALALNNMGMILEMEGNTQSAKEYVQEAVVYATEAGDYVGLEDYRKNLARVTDKLALEETPAPTNPITTLP